VGLTPRLVAILAPDTVEPMKTGELSNQMLAGQWMLGLELILIAMSTSVKLADTPSLVITAV
jgi:hypothetical protein